MCAEFVALTYGEARSGETSSQIIAISQFSDPSQILVVLLEIMNIGSAINPIGFNLANTALSGDVVGRVVAETSPLSSDDAAAPVTIKGKDELLKKHSKTIALKIEEKKSRRKKKWKKPKDKPSRPLSAYNFFFQSERSQMLGDDAPSQELENLKKRVHCKTHGKIGFAEMAKAVGAKWKALEPEKRKEFEDLARKEKERYARELAVWKEVQKEKSSKVAQRRGLDAIAVAALNPSSTESCPKSSVENIPNASDSLTVAMAEDFQRRNMPMFRNGQGNLERIRALQDQQYGLSGLENPFMNYPNAAEASASALLQHFQQRVNHVPGPAHQNGLMNQAERLSQFGVNNYNQNSLMMMRQLQYMSNNGRL